ncbi:MAG TPA: nucleotidyltransferase family protein [Gemmatimonadales bacterium]|nr:nucleotidyltransferase family protein [Gemmatimonadales bacterium]
MSATSRTTDLARFTVAADATVLEALEAIERGGKAITFVVDADERVIGALTDGDLRRAILQGAPLDGRVLRDAMSRDYAYLTPEQSRAEALDIMRARQIEQLPVLDADGCLSGLHTLHQLVAADERPNQVLILAGGRGTRLQPLTTNLPKPMVTVAGRPILERLILHLMSSGFRHFTLSVSYLAHVIEEHFGDGSRFGCQIQYLRESEPLGTGGPLALLRPTPELPLVVVNGDLMTQSDIGRLVDFHVAGGFAASVGLRPYSIEIPFGVAGVEGDRLVEHREKPTQQLLVNTGMYVFSPKTLALVPAGREYPITLLLETLLEQGLTVGAHVLEDEWLDVGRPEELRRARGGER